MPSNKLIFNPITGAFDTVTDVTDVEQRITNLSASNLGAGSGVFATKVADDFQFKSLVAGQNTKINSSSTQLTLEASSSYIANNNFEFNATGWATYADAAAPAPVDGTGGSPTIVFVRTTNAPLSGAASGYFAKNASGSSQQGQGVSYDFDIDLADRAQVLNIQFDYNTSTNYVDGDIRVYVFARGANEVIEVIDRDLYASSFGKFSGTFQTRSDVSAYRLIFHIASTNTNTYEVMIDNVFVGSKPVVKGPIVTDWEEYTPTLTGVTASATDFFWKRVGDSIEITGELTVSAVSGAVTFTLPSGLSIDSSKRGVITNGAETYGTAVLRDTGSNSTLGVIVYSGGNNTFVIQYAGDTINSGTSPIRPVALSSTAPFTWAAGDFITVKSFSIPILGWSSNVVLSDDAGNRDISFAVTKSASQTGINTNNTRVLVTWNTIESDSSASFNTTTSQFTAPESGKYFFSASITIAATNVLAANYALVFFKNNVQITGYGIETPTAATAVGKDTSIILDLSKGDTIDVRLYGAGNNSVNTLTINPGSESRFSGYKLPSPQTIAASEIVACRYNTNTARAVSDATAIIFEDLVYDTHNSYNTTTGQWTCPQSGYYRFDSNIETNAFTPSAINNYLRINARNTTTSLNTMGPYQVAKITGSAIYTTATINVVLYVAKGDVIELRFSETIPAVNLSTDSTANWMSITKVSGVS